VHALIVGIQMNLSPYSKSLLKLIGRFVLGFTTGSIAGGLLFGSQKSIDDEFTYALGALVMTPLSYPLILPMIFPLLSVIMKSCILLGTAGVVGASIVWLRTGNRGALEGVAVASAMVGLPNSKFFQEVLTL
jgi:hypothetical protein